MRIKHITLSLLTALVASCAQSVPASEADCLTRIIYAEARGESLSGLIAVGHATKNRAAKSGKPICRVTGVKRATPPANEYAGYRAIASGILSGTIHNNTKQANAWNTGTKPRQPGKITRVIGNHVFYAMAEQ